MGYMREVRILACVSRTCMYLACIRLRVGALAIEVLATALARVHAFDPLEELALLAAVEAARWLGLLGLLLVCSLVEALCAFRVRHLRLHLTTTQVITLSHGVRGILLSRSKEQTIRHMRSCAGRDRRRSSHTLVMFCLIPCLKPMLKPQGQTHPTAKEIACASCIHHDRWSTDLSEGQAATWARGVGVTKQPAVVAAAAAAAGLVGEDAARSL